MSTNYPTSLDSYTRPSASDPRNSPSHAGQHDNAYDAIEALETKVGTTAQTGTNKGIVFYDSTRFGQHASLTFDKTLDELVLANATKLTFGTRGKLYAPSTDLLQTDQALNVAGFLSGSAPMCRVYHNADQTFSDNTATTVSFNSERFDTDTMHSTSTNTGRITFNTAGKYMVGACVDLQADNIQYTQLNIRLNGSTSIVSQYDRVDSGTGSFDTSHLNVSTLYAFSASDYIEVRVNGSSSNLNTITIDSQGNYAPEFWAIKVAN